MKTLHFKLLPILLISLVILASCSEDKAKVSLFIGNYVITEATVAESFTVPVTGIGDVPVPIGTPITEAIQAALLSAVSCSSADKTYIELREDFSLFMSCEGANPLNAGTWSEVTSSQLLLNLNSTAVPSAPAGIALTVTDVVKDGNILTGKTSVPLPKAMVQAILTAINESLTLEPSAPEIFVIKFSLKFTQK
jgi:hypothetical protein